MLYGLQVSILVLMDLSLQRVVEGSNKRSIGVSILVLMDLSLQLYFQVQILNLSFNPCFNGSFTSTGLTYDDLEGKSRVSILVLMDLSLQHNDCGTHLNIGT